MARRKISDTQAICIILLWVFIVYWLLTSAKHIDFMVIFSIIASGIIVFVPLYKNRRKKE